MVGLKIVDFASKWRIVLIMGRRSWMEGMEVRVVAGDPMPEYELEALRELVKKVTLRILKEKVDSKKCELVYRPAWPRGIDKTDTNH